MDAIVKPQNKHSVRGCRGATLKDEADPKLYAHAVKHKGVGMRGVKTINPVVRAVGVFSAVAVVVGGVTFAALQSQATLTQSSLSTAGAELQVYNFDISNWSNTAPGFTITNLVPGEGVDKQFYLRNNGGVDLNVTASVPTLPEPVGFTDYAAVKVDITGEGCGDTVNTTLAGLEQAPVQLPCNPLDAGVAGDSNADVAGNYNVHFDVDPEAITGGQASVGNFDIVLTGTQVTPL